MQNVTKRSSKIVAILMSVILLAGCLGITSNAATLDESEAGWYTVDASFSAYVSAMGGVEFGAPMLTGTYVEVKEDGSKQITMNLQKSSVTIYGVTCDTFIDPNYPIQVKSGGSFVNVDSYTISDDTALDPENNAVNYVDSITFTISSEDSSYELSVYINSNVMGVQFGVATSSGGMYESKLSVDWSS